jgi:hypothetical protein
MLVDTGSEVYLDKQAVPETGIPGITDIHPIQQTGTYSFSLPANSCSTCTTCLHFWIGLGWYVCVQCL